VKIIYIFIIGIMCISTLHSDREHGIQKASITYLIQKVNLKDTTKSIMNSPLLNSNKKCFALTLRCLTKHIH